MLNRATFTLTVLTLLSATACGPPAQNKQPLNSAQAKLQVADNLAQNITHFADAADFAMNSFGANADDPMQCPPTVIVDEETGKPEVVETQCDPADGKSKNPADEINEAGAELVKFLNERVFTPDQLESEDNNTVIYKIDPKNICEDEKCVETLTKYPLRIRLVSPSAGNVDITILVGKDKLEPLSFSIHQTKLAVTVDVGVTIAIAKELLADAGEKADMPDATGKVRLTLAKTGPKAARLTLDILKAVAFEFAHETGKISSKIKPGSVFIEADAAAKLLTGDVNLGALSVSIPYQLLVNNMAAEMCFQTPSMDEPECEKEDVAQVSGNLALTIAGLTANVVFDPAHKTIDVTGFGFGANTAKLTLNGQTVVALDLNKNNGRKVDFSLFEAAKKVVQIDVLPLVDVMLETHLSAIAEVLDDDMPDMMTDDVLNLLFDGANVPSVQVIKKGLKVLAGKLTITSKNAPQSNITVEAGQCLVEAKSEPAPGDHPLLSGFEPGMCSQ